MSKKKLAVKVLAAILAVCGAFSATSCEYLFPQLDSSSEVSQTPEPTVPETGLPQKTDLVYADAIESYQKTDFTANWIWTQYSPEDTYVAMRKTFTLEQDSGEALAYISAESKYFLWVNGELTVYDGSTKRGPTPYDSYFDTVKINNLKKGENTLAFLIAYNGRSGDSSIDGAQALGEGATQGGLLFEMEVGGKKIVSDHTWKVKTLSEYKNKRSLGAQYPAYPQSSMLAERNIWYDERESVGEFTAKTFDDSAWENATLVAKPGTLPFGDLYASVIPLIEFGSITEFADASAYIGKAFTSDTTIELALPKNCQFSAYFETDGEAGKKITYYTDTFQIADTTSYTFKDTYITGAGKQSYESYPWRSGSKLILEVEAGVKFTKIGYRLSGYAVEENGSFDSSNAMLNQLWEMCANTVDICMRDTYMDCPDRERGPYMGDSTNQMDIAYYAFGESAHAMNKKMILSATAWTGKDGLIPSRAPSFKSHEIPVQSLAFSTSVYNYYMQTGDKETVGYYYNALSNYLKLWKVEPNGKIELRNGEWTWTDWGEGADVELIQTCWYYYALDTAKKLATALGKTADVAMYDARMQPMKNNFDTNYLQADGYKTGTIADDRANALAVLSGIASEQSFERIRTLLNLHYAASPYMERFVLQAMCQLGDYAGAITRMTARYTPMVTSGCTTVWELFKRSEGTDNHGWSAGPLLILSSEIAGIKPTAAGYASYEIKPENVLDSMNVTVSTAKGDIGLKYVKEGEKTTFTITTFGGNGTLKLPVSFGMNVTGANVEKTEGGYHIIKIESAQTLIITVNK